MTTSEPPAAVLFVCNLNRVRSPVAAALLRRRLGARTFVDSCGLEPADDVDPMAAAVMAEIGCDLSGHRPKGLDEVLNGTFDLVISLSVEARRSAEALSRGRAAGLEFWPIADPTLEEGSRTQRLDAYRAMRADIARRVEGRFPATESLG